MFIGALGHNLQLVLLSIIIQLPLALGLALLVRGIVRGSRHLPHNLLYAVCAFRSCHRRDLELHLPARWRPDQRPASGIIPGFKETALLANPSTVLYALFGVITWKFFGYHMILYIAGLQNIPAELEEAAQIDGCGKLQTLRYITIPLLGNTIRLSIYLSVLGSLQFFDLIWVMTTGGPVSASDTMATYLYKFGFQRFQLGYGSAIAVIIFLICFSFSLIYQRVAMRRDFE